jgi:hypothetical protein
MNSTLALVDPLAEAVDAPPDVLNLIVDNKTVDTRPARDLNIWD